ncbi:MAG: B12-binding domain-containing radical SAM protein [Deltaproteobacteria bacterium]|nr:B12-binding domain-containing radical SAM protein [Deltaproteobacteria bacterium]
MRILLVGLFRSFVPEGGDSPFGSQGGFVDTLAPHPFSLANACLKSFALADPSIAARHTIELLDLAEPLELEDDREEVALTAGDVDRILAFDPDVVGFSGYCWNVDAIGHAAAALKQRRPGIRIVLGGRATSGDPEEILASQPGLDVLVVGEGELPFREMLRLDFEHLEQCPGVVARRGSEIVRGAPPASVQDLDAIPSPYQLGMVSPALHGMMLELGRGCIHACGYCTWNSDKQLRHFGPSRVEADIRWALERGHRHITLNDSAINYDTPTLVRLVEAIRRADPQGSIRFTYNVRHDRISPEQLDALSRLPTHMVLCGIETLLAPGMREVDRDAVDGEALRKALEQVSAATRPPVVSIVLGLPGDTEEGFRHTLETLLSWCEPVEGKPPAAGTVLVSLLQVYRGSKLWHRRKELGLRFEDRGIPYLIEGGGWTQQALARCKAFLVERMTANPDRLKAAEAIALMPARGGMDPWVSPEAVGKLIVPWQVGMTHDGWTLEKIGVMRDTGRGALLRFRWHQGGGVRVRVTRRNPDRGSRICTRHFDLSPVPLHGPMPPRQAASRLMKLVYAAITRNETSLPHVPGHDPRV